MFYDVAYDSVAPLAVPLQGGTQFTVRGNNIAEFGVGTKIGALNIYAVASQERPKSFT